jgi:hypothetical protein
MAVEAGHPLLIMDVGRSAEVSREFGIDPSPVTRGAGLAVIFRDEFVALEEPRADARYPWRPDVAVTAGGVAAPAGLLEDLLVEYLALIGGEPARHAMPESGGGEVEGVLIRARDLIMTFATDRKVCGRSLDEAGVCLLPGSGILIAAVAGNAAFGKVGIAVDKLSVHEICLVTGLRRNRRRDSRSPHSFLEHDLDGFMKGSEYLFVGMAFYAAAFSGMKERRRDESDQHKRRKKDD